jgi:hypothetical protein
VTLTPTRTRLYRIFLPIVQRDWASY